MLRRCPAPSIVLAAALAFGLGVQPPSSRADVLTSNSNTSNTSTVTLEYTLKVNQNYSPVSGSPPAQGSSNPPSPQILAMVSPVSIVTPPASSSSGPLQIVSDSGGYYYNNPNELAVYVGNSPSNGSSITQQALGLSFYGQGLTAGESVAFTLTFDKSNVDSSTLTPPQFTAYDPSTLQPYSSSNQPFTISFDKMVTSTSGSSSSSSTSTSTSTSTSGSGSSASTSTSTSTSTSSDSGSTTITPQGGTSGQGSEVPEPLSLLVWSAMAGAGIWQVRTARARAGRREARP